MDQDGNDDLILLQEVSSDSSSDVPFESEDFTMCPPPPPQPNLFKITEVINSNQRQRQEDYDSIKRKKRKIEQINNNIHQETIKTATLNESTSNFTAFNAALDFGNTEDWIEQLVDGDAEEQTPNDHNQCVEDSIFWTQSIAPGKFYTRSKSGGQLATQSLRLLQQQFEQNVIDVIKSGLASQLIQSPATQKIATSSSCNNCSGHDSDHHHLTSYSSSSNDEESDASSSLSLSENGLSDEDENEQMDKFWGRRRGRRRGRRLLRRNPSSIDEVMKQRRRQKQERAAAVQRQQKEQIERRRAHPAALHPDIGFNQPGTLNDGQPLCKCSWAARQMGIRHGKFQGEAPIPRCRWDASNIDELHHYVLRVDPEPAQYSRRPTQIQQDGHCYTFDGFSVFFHRLLPERFPQRPINQWTQQFRVRFLRENAPESFTIADLELFHTYFFDQVLELLDLDRQLNIVKEKAQQESCYFYHCLPRFARQLPDNGKELLPMSAILTHFLGAFNPLMGDQLAQYFQANPKQLPDFAHSKKGQICVNPTKKPMAIRMDFLDVADSKNSPYLKDSYPMITHFGLKPSAYAFAKRPQYQEAYRNHMELRKQLAGQTLNAEQKQQLRESETNLLALKQEIKARKETIIRLNSRGFYCTGIYPDMVEHAMLLVLACQHVRFHCSLDALEENVLGYKFKNRGLLELALIHPSFRSNYGTNPDHAKNVLSNCGIRNNKVANNEAQNDINKGTPTGNEINRNGATPTQPDHLSQSVKTCSGRRRGIQVLMEIMAMQGQKHAVNETENASAIRHNERLEFLGDAVVEFLSTVHLFFLFTELDEGGLATFRSTLVQNRHLATLADRLGLQHFMVYAHGPDLCHEADLRHAMANAFEALMAAIFLDAGLDQCDRIFANSLFKDEPQMLAIWNHLPEHPLKRNNPHGDRHLVDSVPCLQQLAQFEQSIGIRFKHIRLLAKAFTRRNVPYNFLTLGHNQRLEFLGDTVLQLLSSEFLYKHFPYHQEGHLSLLRTCLVSNQTQAVIADDLAIGKYLVIPQAQKRKYPPSQLRIKDKADLVESLLGAIYVDRGLLYCRQFCRVCFFPRLKHFILSQRWNDPKSQLQQCCLSLRSGDGEPAIPEYKTIGIQGPTNTRIYQVAVYFRKKRLAVGSGATVHQAQMEAAERALVDHGHLFPTFQQQNAINGQQKMNENNGKSESFSKNKVNFDRNHGNLHISNGIKRQRSTVKNFSTPMAKDKHAAIQPLLSLKIDAPTTPRAITTFQQKSIVRKQQTLLSSHCHLNQKMRLNQQNDATSFLLPPPPPPPMPSVPAGTSTAKESTNPGNENPYNFSILPPPPPPPKIT